MNFLLKKAFEVAVTTAVAGTVKKHGPTVARATVNAAKAVKARFSSK